MSTGSNNFLNEAVRTHPNLLLALNVFPKNAESFECSDDGRFTIVYSGNQETEAHYGDMTGSIKVSRVVKGRFYSGNELEEGVEGAVTFSSGVRVDAGYPIDISLKKIAALADSTNLLVQGGRAFINPSFEVAQDEIVAVSETIKWG